MGAVAFYPQSLFSFNKQLKLGKPMFSPREIADWSSPFAFQKNPWKLSVVCISSDGSGRRRPPRKGSAAGTTKKRNRTKTPQLSDGEVSGSSKQEEMIALFKRIQSSISEEGSVSTKKRNPSSSDSKRTVESVLDVLQHAKKEAKDTSSIKDEEMKEQEIRNNEPVADFKFTRLPSNFVKRSPIPSSSAQRVKDPELKSEATENVARGEQLNLPRVEELKLPELKELAKARGLKGYSRLKKSELVKLLRS